MISDGIINVNKSQNMTSHDVVAILRRVTGVKRTGHTGTLDPMATGVLLVCIGSATRIMEYLDADLKTYECAALLGISTDTDDIWGRVLAGSGTEGLSRADVTAAFCAFVGKIRQMPPMYSARKIDGRKLYEYAREGREAKVKAREVYIDDIEITEIESLSEYAVPDPERNSGAGDSDADEAAYMQRRRSGAFMRVRFKVKCSKGTYIRSICRDVGKILGCGGTMESLVRTKNGVFDIDDAVDIMEIREMTEYEIARHIQPVDTPLAHFGKGIVRYDRVGSFLDGLTLSREQVKIERMPMFSDLTKECTKAENCIDGNEAGTALERIRAIGIDKGVKEESGKLKVCGLPTPSKYRKAYCLYGKNGDDEEAFLGVALYEKNRKLFAADKIFCRKK